MRWLNLRWLGVVVALALVGTTVGCGGGASNSYDFELISVTSMVPGSVPGLVPTLVTINGGDYSEVVGDGSDPLPVPECTVIFTAVSPAGVTPFKGGTANRVEVRGLVTSNSTITCTSPLATICGPTSITARIRVVLPSGVTGESVGAIATFLAPTVSTIVAQGGGNFFPAAIPTPYTLNGANFPAGPPFGQQVLIHWLTTPPGTPPLFGGPVAGTPPAVHQGTSADIITLGTVTSPTTITGISPLAVVCQPGVSARSATIDRVEFPDGSCTPVGTAVATGFRAPTIVSITNDTVGSPYAGFPIFAAAIPESFFITGADFGPTGGTCTVTFTEAGGLPIFEGGTTATTVVEGQIISQTTIEGISPPALMCAPGFVPSTVDVSVTLPGGSCTPAPAPCTYNPSTAISILNDDITSPHFLTNVFAGAVPESFRLSGTDFGPIGELCQVVFTDPAGAFIFEGGTTNTTVVMGVIVSRSTIVGISPPAVVCNPLAAAPFQIPTDVNFILPSGNCGPAPVPAVFQAPQYRSILNLDRGGGDFVAAIPERFQISGLDFGPDGGTAFVTFTSNLGNTVFTDAGGALVAAITVPAVIVNRNTIEGVSPEALLCPTLGVADFIVEAADIDVVLEGGSCIDTQIAATNFLGPTVTDITVEIGTATYAAAMVFPLWVPSTLPLNVTEHGEFTIFGTGFGPLSSSVDVTFTDTTLTGLFNGANSVTVPGLVLSETTIVGTDFPTITTPRLIDDLLVDVSITLVPNASCAHSQSMLNFVAPPTITVVQGTENGLGAGFLTNSPLNINWWEACISSEMTITGHGFHDGTGTMPETDTFIYDQASGLDASALPVRRIGQDPVLSPSGNDLGKPSGAAPVYTVTVAAAPATDSIVGNTRIDKQMAVLDTDGNGAQNFVVRTIDPMFGQFHEFSVVFWFNSTISYNATNAGAVVNNNVEVTVDPTSMTNDFLDASLGANDTVDGANMVMVTSNDAAPGTWAWASGVQLWYTLDSGKNWAVGAPIDVTADGLADGLVGPVVRSFGMAKFDRFGNLWICYRADDPNVDFSFPGSGSSHIVLLLSTDQGQSIASSFILRSASGANLDRPYLAVGRDGLTSDQIAYASFVDYEPNLFFAPETIREHWVSITGFAGGTSGPAGGGVPDAGNIGFPFPGAVVALDTRCAVGPGGELYVSWTEADFFGLSPGTSEIWWNVDRDGRSQGPTYGWNFTSAFLLASQGVLFGPPPGQPDAGLPGHDITVVQTGTNSGRAVFVYEELDDISLFFLDPQRKQVVSWYTDDYGLSLIGPFVVHQTDTSDQFLPRVTSDTVTGTLYVSWYDSKSAPTTNVPVQRFSAASANAITWGNPMALHGGTYDGNLGTFDFGDLGGSQAAYDNCVLSGFAGNPGLAEMDAILDLGQQTTATSP